MRPGDPRLAPASVASAEGERVLNYSFDLPFPFVFAGRSFAALPAVADPSIDWRNLGARLDLAGTLGTFVPARYELDFARHRLRFSTLEGREARR
jgi:hypothetical protein